MWCEPARTDGNESTTLLKLIALAFMFCDHAGKMLFPGIPEMRLLGRIAFPLYCWSVVVGSCYTRSFPKYILRLLAVGLVSQPLYNLALNHTWQQPNVFLTLAMGITAIWAIRENRYGSRFWGPMLILLATAAIKPDYDWKGVLLIIMLYACRERRGAIASMMTAFCLYWGSSSSVLTKIFGISLNFSSVPALSSLLAPWLKLQGMAVLSLPLILWHCRAKIKVPKAVMYAVYPGHLVILYILEKLAGVK